MNRTFDEGAIPLSPIEYQILVAIAGRPLSGYGVAQQSRADSEGVITISQGTLYPALKRLQLTHLISNDGQAYHLTSPGWLVLEQETSRLRQATAFATAAIRRHQERTRGWAEIAADL